jgi:GR25 family glycosyltransferase involved in LPS biosynthesis
MKLEADSDFDTYGNVLEATLLYASLDEQVARRKSVIRNLKGRVPFAFVRCVDGRSWSEAETEAVLSEAMRDRRRKEFAKGRDWLTKGAIACAMTHRSNMIGRISGFGKVLCEDDVVISDKLIELLAGGAIQRKLEALDGVTRLDYRSRSDIIAEREPVVQVGNYTVHKVRPSGLGSAACYFVPSSIAPKIVELQTALSVPVDHWDEMIKGRAFDNLYVVHPRPARVGDFPTTIGYAYSKKSLPFYYISRIVLLRRMKYALMRLRGQFKDSITHWVDII